jgi:3-hydroxyisobutyrate dehydrogenase-like beta-hydroxyacid dehydrogenase
MGATVAATLKNSGHNVLWTAEGRSERTKLRATQVGLEDAGSVAVLASRSEIILSICPPEFADAVADEVLAAGFHGIFVDANAITPRRTRVMAERMQPAGIAFIDGGIIGAASRDPLKLKPETVWLYLSGALASQVAECFSAGPVLAEVVGPEPGQASGLKMCFAAYNKGRAALLASTLAAAEQFGVRAIVHDQMGRRGDPTQAEAERFVTAVAPRAWRWVAEMREISETFESVGLPGEFHEGAAQLYEMLRGFKDQDQVTFDEVLRAMMTTNVHP